MDDEFELKLAQKGRVFVMCGDPDLGNILQRAAREISELKRKLAESEARYVPQIMAADPDRTALLLANEGRAILEDRCMHTWNAVAYYGGTSRPFIAQCSKCGTTDPS